MLKSMSTSVHNSRKLTLEQPYDGARLGDLLLAAIVSQGGSTGGVTPPSGWTEVPGSDQSNGTTARIQVFSHAVDSFSESQYTFTTGSPQDMAGGLTDFFGHEANPISASGGEANAAVSTSVTAPSIIPTSADTILVFVGGVGSAERWQAPGGMKLQYSQDAQAASVGMATELWPPLTATGIRAASISAPAASVGDLIALSYPALAACPRMALLTHRAHVTPDGLAAVRLKCESRLPCVGAFEDFQVATSGPGKGAPLNETRLIASDFAVAEGETQTVQVALTSTGRRLLAQRRTIRTGVWLWLRYDPQLPGLAPDNQISVVGLTGLPLTVIGR